MSSTVISEYVNQRRLSQGITNRQLAQSLGMSESFVSDLCHGRRALPLKSVNALARALRIEPSELAEVVINAWLSEANLPLVAKVTESDLGF